MAQLHKKFTDGQVKEMLKRYLNNEIERPYIQQILGIGKSRFFALLKSYQDNPTGFSIQYRRQTKTHSKIERPYQWLQDHLVRTCVRDNTTDIRPSQNLPAPGNPPLQLPPSPFHHLRGPLLSLEVPFFRFQKALKQKQSLFRDFQIQSPYKSVKDIFCLRLNRTVDAYRRVSLNNRLVSVNHANPGDTLNVRFYPLTNGLTELRFWRNHQLLDVQTLKTLDLKGVQF